MILVVSLLQFTGMNIINSWLRRLFVFMACLLLSGFLVACGEKQDMRISGPIMGTEYNITLLCGSDLSQDAWQTELMAVMQQVNQAMSTYIPDSELSQFNQLKNTEFQTVSSSIIDVFSAAQRVSYETEGAFDITVLPLVELWGFGSQKSDSLSAPSVPSKASLLKIGKQIGFEKIELDDSFTQWRKTDPDVMVDFSAIAKGYAVDQVSNKLMELGCVNHLVEIGGELRAEGLNSKGKPWRLAVEKPSSKGGFQVVIDVSGVSVASSGDYRNFYMVDGKRYSHTVDPRTLKPVEHNLAAVTVIDPIAARADALATAFMVMGPSGLDFAEENNIPAFFIFRAPSLSTENDAQHQVLYSQAFEQFIVNQ